MIKLSFYKKEHYSRLQSFYLPPFQKSFTALPLEILEISLKDEDRFPIVIEMNQHIVGFFVLHKGHEIREYTSNPNGMLLRALSINYCEQGKGYGTNALKVLPAFIKEHFKETTEVVLAVNHNNSIAKKLYERIGFCYKGRRRYGFLKLKYVFHYSLPIKCRAVRTTYTVGQSAGIIELKQSEPSLSSDSNQIVTR